MATPRQAGSGDGAGEKDNGPSQSTAWYLAWLFLNLHFHMLFLDGVYLDRSDGARFRGFKPPTNQEFTQLARTIAHRVGRFLERQGLLERDADTSYPASDAVDDDPMKSLPGHSIT